MNIYAHTFTVYIHIYISIIQYVLWNQILAFHPGLMSEVLVTTGVQKNPTSRLWAWRSSLAARHELTAQKLLFYQKKETQLFHSERDLSIRTLKRWTDRNITNMWLRQNCVHIQFSWNLRFICICKLLFFIQAVRFYRNPWTACFPYAKNSPTTAKSFLTCFD